MLISWSDSPKKLMLPVCLSVYIFADDEQTVTILNMFDRKAGLLFGHPIVPKRQSCSLTNSLNMACG